MALPNPPNCCVFNLYVHLCCVNAVRTNLNNKIKKKVVGKHLDALTALRDRGSQCLELKHLLDTCGERRFGIWLM